MLWAAQDRGWELFYMAQGDLFLDSGEPKAVMRELKVHRDPAHWYDLGEPKQQLLAELDVILMRKDPPFDNEYIYSTYILEAAEALGVLVVNKPQSLRDCNEKMFATQFPQCCPPLLVSRDMQLLKDFHKLHQDVVFKPLDGMGGSLIFRVRADDPNVNVILESLTGQGRQTIMAQRYLPAIKDGDKRILLVDGEPIPYCLARVPMAGESRGNLAAGGTGRPQPLTERDRWIAAQVGPSVRERGLLFVGLDVIGEYLTEINVTSPTCVREIDAAYDTGIAVRLMDCIEGKLSQRA
jgi:glutathione synthase